MEQCKVDWLVSASLSLERLIAAQQATAPCTVDIARMMPSRLSLAVDFAVFLGSPWGSLGGALGSPPPQPSLAADLVIVLGCPWGSLGGPLGSPPPEPAVAVPVSPPLPWSYYL